MPRIKVKFVKSGLGKAKCPPNPKFPNGMAIKLPYVPGSKTCFIKFPLYPAPETGVWSIHCEECGLTSLITVAGRIDDPVSIELPCKNIYETNLKV